MAFVAFRQQTRPFQRCLGDGVRGPPLMDLPENWRKAKELFTKPALSYADFKQRCVSFRLFAFAGVCGGCALSLALCPPKSSYWITWSPSYWFSQVRRCVAAAPPLFLHEKPKSIAAPSLLRPSKERFEAKSEVKLPAVAVKPQVLFVLGGPGAGKGTQCARICTNFEHWQHISAGDCLRMERNDPNSKDGELINSFIKEGKIVPVQITVRLLQKAMLAGQEAGKTHFLIDGFPRNLDNVNGWEEVIGNSADVMGVLFFEASEEEMQKRLLGRSATSGRVDDNLESIRKRFTTYEKETRPIVDKYKKMDMVFNVDAMQDVDHVWAHTLARLQHIELIAKFGR